jgi:archaellum component FlaC
MIQKNNVIEYYNTRLVKLGFPWKCTGVTHEYWDGANTDTITKEEMASYVDTMMEKVMMAIEEVAKEVGTVKEEMASYKSKMEKMSKTPGATKITTFNNEAPTSTDPIENQLEGLKTAREEFRKSFKKF